VRAQFGYGGGGVRSCPDILPAGQTILGAQMAHGRHETSIRHFENADVGPLAAQACTHGLCIIRAQQFAAEEGRRPAALPRQNGPDETGGTPGFILHIGSTADDLAERRARQGGRPGHSGRP
jgi:hypothetical protein